MDDRMQAVRQGFLEGKNCSQSMLLAFRDVAGLSKEQAELLAAGLGGGMCRIRNVCGAFSAMVLLAGYLTGPDGGTPQAKPRVYELVQKMQKEFIVKNGSFICAELLKKPPVPEVPIPDERTGEYYQTRPCIRVLENACRILETYVETQNAQ